MKYKIKIEGKTVLYSLCFKYKEGEFTNSNLGEQNWDQKCHSTKWELREKFVLNVIFKFEGKFTNWNLGQQVWDQKCHFTKYLKNKNWGEILCFTLYFKYEERMYQLQFRHKRQWDQKSYVTKCHIKWKFRRKFSSTLYFKYEEWEFINSSLDQLKVRSNVPCFKMPYKTKVEGGKL